MLSSGTYKWVDGDNGGGDVKSWEKLCLGDRNSISDCKVKQGERPASKSGELNHELNLVTI